MTEIEIIEKHLEEWTVCRAKDLTQILNCSASTVTRIISKNVLSFKKLGWLLGKDKDNLPGEWITTQTLFLRIASEGGVETSNGYKIQRHYLYVAAAYAWIREALGEGVNFHSERYLRKELGWFCKSSKSPRSTFFTYVPDFLLNFKERTWRVEVQISRVLNNYFDEMEGLCHDQHPILLVVLPGKCANYEGKIHSDRIKLLEIGDTKTLLNFFK